MDLVVVSFLQNPDFWNYVFPLNVIAAAFYLLGVGLQILSLKKRWKWFLFPLIWLALSVSCDYIYCVTGTFEVFAVGIFGWMTYFALFGAIIGGIFYKIWVRVRHL